MESWTYDSVEKGFTHSNETVFPPDCFDARANNVLMGWGLKDPSSHSRGNGAFFGTQQPPFENQRIFEVGFPHMVRKQSSHEQPPFENQRIFQVGFQHMVRKQSSHDSIRNGLSSNGSGEGDVINANTITSNANSGEEESSSKLSIPAVESSSRESSLIDLKLGRFSDGLNYNATGRRAPALLSAESSTPAKRVRSSGLSSQPAFCQVYGCNKDLCNSKDYHKRHKVCEVHSKTPKVIVNGIEQRFCQQCSRFHLLGEFDDVKRSCRKRLAGHNERRRKPQIGLDSSRAARVLHSYNGSVGSKSDEITLSADSFICQDILPSSAAHSDKSEIFDCHRHIKLENGPIFTSKLPNACFNWNLQQKPGIPLYGCGKQQYPLSSISENVNQYSSQENISHSFFQTNSLGSEDLTLFDTASTVRGLQEISEPGCALSLLSSQPQSSSPHISEIPTSIIQPLIIPESGSHYNVSEVSQNLFNFSAMGLSSGGSDKYSPACGVGSDQLTSTIPPGNNDDATSGSDFRDGILHGSDIGSVRGQFSSFGDGSTVDLLQMSTQLQRVKNQKQAVPMKQENDSFCCLQIPEPSKSSFEEKKAKNDLKTYSMF